MGASAAEPDGRPAGAAALTRAYLGDVALLSATRGSRGAGGLALYVERYFAHSFALRAQVTSAAPGPLQATALALDYRSDALAVWARDGASTLATCPRRACRIPRSASPPPARA